MLSLQQRVIPYLLVTLAVLVCVVIYRDGLYGPLVLDDMSVLGNILGPEFGPDKVLQNLLSDSGLLKRPVSMLSFMLNGLAGNSLFYWKATNLAIHLGNGVLLFFLTGKLIRCIDSRDTYTAAIVTAAWILHPLQVSTVLYTVQRMTELSALFVFAAMLTYTIARERQKKGAVAWPMQIATWLVLFPLGLLSKENALLLPAFIVLIEAFFLSREKLSNQQFARIAMVAALLLVAVLAIKSDWLLGGYTFRSFTLTERLLTESRALIAYLGMLLIPVQSRMGFVHDDMLLSRGLLDPWTTLPSIFIVVALITAPFFLRKKYPLIGFGILFFLVGQAMESTVFSLELMYEHRNYLPSFGIFLATAAGINTLIKSRLVITTFTVAIFSLLILVTYGRTQTWASIETLYTYMETIHPRSERLATIKATQYAGAGEYALAHSTLEGFSSMGVRLQHLNIDCAENRSLEDKQLNLDIKKSNLANNHAIMQLTNLANMGLDNECRFSPDLFLALLKNINTLPTVTRNNRQIVLMYQAHYLWSMRRQDEALETLLATFELNKNNPTPLFLACEWMLDTNRLKESEGVCSKAFSVADKAPFNKFGVLADKVRGRLESPSTR